MPRRPPPHRPAGDAGRVSIFIAIAISGLMMVLGIAIDATGQLRTLMRADNLAAEAARAAGQAIDIDHVAATGEHRLDEDLAQAYAVAYLNTAGHGQGATHTVGLSDDGDTIVITVQLPYQNRVLGAFGRSDVTVTATATAVLVREP